MEYLRAKKFHKFTKDYQKLNSVNGLEQPNIINFMQIEGNGVYLLSLKRLKNKGLW